MEAKREKHTPGPWKVRGDCQHVVFSDERETAICMVNIAVNHGISIAQAQADARLIAAAPELLAALRDAQEELRLIRMKDTGAVYDPTVRIRIAAAITKATGGNHE